MKATTIRFRVASPNIVSETFEGEVVVVNLDSGLYFSLEGSGALCWQLATAGLSADAIVAEIRRRFETDDAAVDQAIRTFLEELTADGLLTVHDADACMDDDRSPVVQALSNGSAVGKEFSPPVINRYSDMRELLLIDPVHMVGDSGWPAARPNPRPNDV